MTNTDGSDDQHGWITYDGEAQAVRPLVQLNGEGVHLLHPLLQLVLSTGSNRVNVVVPTVVLVH